MLTIAVLITLHSRQAGPKNYFGVFSPYFSSLLAAIYLWKFAILRSRWPRASRQVAFVILLALAMPFVYFKCIMLPTYASYWTHLVVTPLWVLTIPVVSFFFFDQKKKLVRFDEYWLRSLIELTVLVPIWSVILSIVTVYLGLAEIYYIRGC